MMADDRDETGGRRRLGQRLRSARQKAELTQADAARRLGISNSALSELELGRRRLDALLLVRMATLYRTGTDDLAGGPMSGQALPEDLSRLLQMAGGLPEAERQELIRMAEWLSWRVRDASMTKGPDDEPDRNQF